MRIVLDAGHGKNVLGLYTGARANGLIEDVVVKEIEDGGVAHGLVDRLGWWLRKAGHTTIYTRHDDRACGVIGKTDISNRVKVAKAAHGHLFVSLHCNAAASSAARGFEIFVAQGGGLSRLKAIRVESAIKLACGADLPSRGVKWDSQSAHKSLGVLRGLQGIMPAMLIEVGFLTNLQDVRLLNNRQFRQKFCEAIAVGLGSAS